MRPLIYAMMVSLDGYVAGPNGELDWHIIDEEAHTFFNDQQREMDTSLYGRRMYEVMAAWETVDQDASLPAHELEFARIWRVVPKVVFSTTLQQVQGNARLVRDHVGDEIRRLKRQPGQAMDIGGPTLASTAIELGLIDEYRLYVHPVVLGGGTRYFQNPRHRINLRLVEARTFDSGLVYLRYASRTGR